MRYAHNVARGYDDRAATTRALMCLPAGMMELVRPESMQPQASQRSVLGADTSAATRGLPDWRQDEEETRAKHYSSLASQASLFGAEGVSRERSWAGNPAIARALATAAASTFWQRRCSFRSSVLSPLYCFLRRFFSSSCSAAEHKASQCVQAHIPQSTALLPRLLRTE